MHLIAAATRQDEAAVRLRRAVRHSAAECFEFVVPSGAMLVAGSDGGSVLGFARSETEAVAVFGSGSRRVAADPMDAAASLLTAIETRGNSALMGLDDDLVVIAITSTGEIVLGTGNGPTRMFRRDDERTTVVSTQANLLGASRSSPSIDRSYEDFLLAYAFLPDDRTVHSDVRAIPMRSVIRLGPREESRSFLVPGNTVPRPGSATDVSRILYDLLLAAVERQAGTARDHAVLLGGVDSALVAALLRRLGRDIHSFTFEFEDARYNQGHIDDVIRSTGATHTWVPITAATIEAGLHEYGAIFNQPAAQPHYLLHTLAASRAIRDAGFSHAFSGDGCDATFLGYPTVSQRARLMETSLRIPRRVRSAARRSLAFPPAERALGQVARKARSVLEQSQGSSAAVGHLPTPILDSVARHRLRQDTPPQSEDMASIRERLADAAPSSDALRRAFHGHALIGQSKAKVEGSVAATGVSQDSPYNDDAVRSFVNALPVDLLRSPDDRAGAPGKRILIDMIEAHDLLPPAVIYQKKQSPASSPIDAWYAGSLRSTVLQRLEDLPFEWNRSYIEAMLDGGIADRWYRRHVASLGSHTLQAIGLLWSYAACVRPMSSTFRS